MSEILSHKRCYYCKEIKPAEEFYKHRTRGLTAECKPCSRQRTRNFRKTPAGKVIRKREHRKYAKTEHGKRALYEGMKRFRKRNPEKIKAVQYLDDKVRAGYILRPTICSRCNAKNIRIEAHHHQGYSREFWLDVVWLCIPCHKSIHQKIKQRASALNPARFSENTLKDIL